MKIHCESCGTALEIADHQRDGRVRCPACRREFTPAPESVSGNPVTGAIADMGGLDRVRGFSWGALFAEAFRPHCEEESERLWSAGAVGNTPSIDQVNTNWPQPWMFVRVLLLSLVLFALFAVGVARFGNWELLPGMVLIGSFALPFALLIFFFEMNARRNVSMRLVLRMFIAGGALALLAALLLFQVAATLKLEWMGALLWAFIEESAKLLIVLLLVRGARYPYVLNGLLLGAAVGAGFIAFRLAGQFAGTLVADAVLGGVVLVGVDGQGAIAALAGDLVVGTLGGQVLWAGMCAAGFWRARGARNFALSQFVDPRFLRVFIPAVILHALWIAPWELKLLTPYDKPILLGVIGWAVIFAVIQSGLNQLRREKAQYGGAPGAEPAVGALICTQLAYVETISAAAAAETAAPAEKAPARGYDHLQIQEQVDASRQREENRQAPSYSQRAWRKYYRKDQD